jgi:hypothetical protein
VRTNLERILSALHDASPESEMILLTVENPYVVVPGLGAVSTQAVQALNTTLSGVATAHGVRIADGYTPLSTPTEICTLTFMCTQQDIHPNDAGYAALTQAVWAASGYERLG